MLVSDIPKDLIIAIKNCDIPEIKETVKDLVILKEDENGRYIEHVFSNEPIPDNRCLSWYDKPQPNAWIRNWQDDFLNKDECITVGLARLRKVEHLYRLSKFDCRQGNKTGDEQCRPGKPCKTCLKYSAKYWTYKEPVKCACWYLAEEVELSDILVHFKLIDIIKLINK